MEPVLINLLIFISFIVLMFIMVDIGKVNRLSTRAIRRHELNLERFLKRILPIVVLWRPMG